MSLDWIRNNYDVPAHRGGRVEYTGGKEPASGTITGAQGGHVLIRLDGRKVAQPYHPTWKLRYLAAGEAACAVAPFGEVREA